MQVAIIIGGWFAIFLGSLVPLILLIVLKTLAELFLSDVTLGPDGSLAPARGTNCKTARRGSRRAVPILGPAELSG